jgi:hypothetical protein
VAPPYQGLDSADLWFYPVVSLKVSSDYNFLYVTVLPVMLHNKFSIIIEDFTWKPSQLKYNISIGECW